ncbi:MAG: TonB-dependent receptor [candidate division KSB1 bacterium]|nr:TonB-dependent receptor [candidate division KSB1 bacterium]
MTATSSLRPASTASEVVAMTPGVTLSSTGPWSQQPVIRGLKGAHVLTLVNGLRLEVLRAYGQHAPLLDVDQVERAEVVRGPHSVMYGSDAVGGVINYLTVPTFVATPRLQMGTAGNLRWSSADGQRAAGARLVLRAPRLNARLRCGARRSEDIRTPKGPLANTQYQGLDADLDLAYLLSPGYLLRGGISTLRSSDVGIPTSPYAEKARFRRYERTVLSLGFEREPRAPSLLALRANVHYQWGAREFEAVLHVPRGAQRIDQSLEAHRSVDSFGANLMASWLLTGRHFVSAGLDLSGEWDDTRRLALNRLYDAKGALLRETIDRVPPTPPSKRLAIGAFFSDEFSPTSRLSVTAGARVDHLLSTATGTPGTLASHDLACHDQNVSGSLGTSFALTPAAYLFANVGRAFKAPDLQERFFKGVGQRGFVIGNPGLKPETSLNFDGGIKWRTARSRGELDLFWNRVADLILLAPISAAADTFRYGNVGCALLRGGEIEVEARLLKALWGHVQAAYVHGTDIHAGRPLPQIPPFNVRLSMEWRAHGRWWAQAATRLVADQRRVAPNEACTPGYALCDVAAGLNLRSLGLPAALTLRITNLFDRSYREHLSTVTWWDAPGRNVIVGMDWQQGP